jgi:hypothetical protein
MDETSGNCGKQLIRDYYFKNMQNLDGKFARRSMRATTASNLTSTNNNPLPWPVCRIYFPTSGGENIKKKIIEDAGLESFPFNMILQFE